MLTGKLVRVRVHRDRVVPQWLDAARPEWLETAQTLLDIFRRDRSPTRGELEDQVEEEFGDSPQTLAHRGLAKLLLDRCEFEVASALPPEQIREVVFRAAALRRREPTFDRGAILAEAAAQLGLTAEQVEIGVFADLKSEQRRMRFEDLSPERLLQRYNVALAQAVLFRCTALHVVIRDETPARYRQLLRRAKFHRLVCEIERGGPGEQVLRFDGPLSLFSATQKYGLQLALFLPAVLACSDFDLRAELLWGVHRQAKTMLLSSADGLVPENADRGVWVPPELAMFVELFRKKAMTWDISDETDLITLGNSFWVPDYRLTRRSDDRVVYLDILGFWRRSHVEKHLERLRTHAKVPFVLAVSEQLRVADEDLQALPAVVHRFRQMPLPDEIIRLADAACGIADA